MAALAALAVGLPVGEARPCTLEDTLALEVMDLSLECERLEVMERQVAATKDALASREVKIQ